MAMVRQHVLGAAFLVSAEASAKFQVHLDFRTGYVHTPDGNGEETWRLVTMFETQGLARVDCSVSLASNKRDGQKITNIRPDLLKAIHVSPLGCEQECCPHAPQRTVPSKKDRDAAAEAMYRHVAERLMDLYIEGKSITEQTVIDIVTEYFLPPVSPTAS